jgi:hypothetical protein
MRIMAGSACKPDASETRALNQWDREMTAETPGFLLCNSTPKLHAIEALICGAIVI